MSHHAAWQAGDAHTNVQNLPTTQRGLTNHVDWDPLPATRELSRRLTFSSAGHQQRWTGPRISPAARCWWNRKATSPWRCGGTRRVCSMVQEAGAVPPSDTPVSASNNKILVRQRALIFNPHRPGRSPTRQPNHARGLLEPRHADRKIGQPFSASGSSREQAAAKSACSWRSARRAAGRREHRLRHPCANLLNFSCSGGGPPSTSRSTTRR